MDIDISKLDKAEVLMILYDNARTQGIGFPSLRIMEPMTRDTALALLQKGTHFDYLDGRIMKVDLSGSMLDPWLYDRDNGQGAAEKAINTLRR